MARITDTQLESRVDRLNQRLLRYRSKRRVRLAGRYDYTAIDEYGTNGILYGTVAAGTNGECYEALGHMIRAIDLEHQRIG